MFVLPLGHEHFSVRRLPWVTLCVAALCLAVQVYCALNEPPIEARIAALAAEIDALEQGAVVAQFEGALRPPEFTPEGEPVPAERRAAESATRARAVAAEIARLRAEQAALVETLPTVRLGYRPGRDGVTSMISSAFVHGGWLHLLGNLVFLYLVGLNMEDRWGSLRFVPFYLGGALASALTFRLWHPQSETVLVGASGAIAALMGAFTVSFAHTRIRFFYAYWFGFKPRFGTFWAPAALALPAWFLQQAALSWLERAGNLGVAHSAHVGGFLFGLVVAGALWRLGIDQRLAEKHALSDDPRDHWSRDPALAEAEGLLRDGHRDRALAVLEELLAREPEQREAREIALEIALSRAEGERVRAHAGVLLALFLRAGELEKLGVRYEALRASHPALDPGESACKSVITAAARGELAARTVIDAVGQLLEHHPASPLVPRALFVAAEAQARAGRDDLARRTLERLVREHPMDPFAERAQRRLSGASVAPQSLSSPRSSR